jgi:XTP/dITP diphosphohydrolase
MSSLQQFDELVIGTHNRKKGVELAEMLAPWGIAVVTLDDVPDAIEVPEHGETFAANAALKATEQARHLGRWVLADDSGLEVDALGGAPGVYSARFAGPNATDEDNNRLLLQRLGDTPLEKRTARYVCHVTLADPTGAIRAESGDECRGRIRFAPAGTHGFGYDPLFEVVEYHRTFGELGPAVKRAISHRSRAMRAILPEIRKAWCMESEARSRK